MMNANKGCMGWSMSVRAAEAYENGEMPKSKWTKKVMLAEIADYLREWDYYIADVACEYLEKLTKDELFSRFFYNSSWHHTGKHYNATEFYALDEQALVEFVDSPTKRTYEIKYSLGNHSVKCSKTFATRAAAEKYLERRGFYCSYDGRCFRRKNFYASISFRKTEI